MIGRWVFWVLGALASPLSAQEPPAFVELDFGADELAWQGERETAVLRIGIEQAFLRENVVELFRRPLDLQLRVRSESWAAFDAAQLRVEALEEGSSLAWNGEVVRVHMTEIERDAARWTVLELPLRIDWQGVAPELLELPPLVLEFDYATEFEEDFLGDRMPLNKQRASVSSALIRRELRALPGAIDAVTFGPAELRADPVSLTTQLGEQFSIVVETHATEGNELYGGQLRLLDGADGWSALGELELEAVPGVMRRRFDFLTRAAGEHRLRFERAVFDPAAQQLATESVEVTVRVVGGASSPVIPPAIGPVDFAEPEGGRPWLLVPLILAGAGLLWVYARAMQAQRLRVVAWENGGSTRTPDGASAPGGPEPLQDWLAGQLGCAPSALVTPRAEQRLLAAGAPESLARDTARFLASCEAARYGGPAVADAAAQREDLRRAWEQHFRSRR